MRLLTLESFRHLHGLLVNNTLYGLKYDRLFRWSAVQQFCFMAPALSLVFGTLGDEIAYPLQIEGPAMSREKVVKLDDERNVVREKISSEVELHLKKKPSLVYEGGKPPVPEAKDMDSRKKKLSSLITSVGKNWRKTTTCGRDAEDDLVRGAEAEQMGIEVDKKVLAAVNRQVETKTVEEAGAERSKDAGTESS